MAIKELRDLEVDEVSLVDIPANKKKFYIVKRGKPFDKNQDGLKKNFEKEVKDMLDLIKVYKELTGVEEISKEELEQIKALSDADIKKIKDALDVLKKYKEDMPDDLKKEIVNLAKLVVVRYPYPYPYPSRNRYPYPYPYPTRKEDEEEGIEKAGRKLSKDYEEAIRKAIEILTKLLPVTKEETSKKEKEKEKEKKQFDVEAELEKVRKEFAEQLKDKDKVLEEAKDEFKKLLEEKDKVNAELTKRLEEVEKVKGVKKSLEEEGKEKIKKEVPWPSFEPDDEE